MSDERVDETDFEIERLRALERIFPRVEAERDALAQEVERLRAAHTQVVEGLRQAREGWRLAEARLREVVAILKRGRHHDPTSAFLIDALAAAQSEEPQPHAFEWAPTDQQESHCCRCGKGIEEHAAAQPEEKP